MTMALDKSQYKNKWEKYTSIPKMYYIRFYTAVLWSGVLACLLAFLCVGLPNSPIPDPVSCLNDRCRCKLHIYIFKIGMIQSKSSWLAWARTMPFLSPSVSPPHTTSLQMLYFLSSLFSTKKKKLWYKCLMLVQPTYTSMKGSIAFLFSHRISSGEQQ